MFSIDCLEILEECDKSLRKNLKPGKYPFNDRYDWNKNGEEKKHSLIKDIPTFFGNKINIQAIVGNNGSGKSTLMDLMYMAINNFAYMFERGNKRPGAEPLFFVQNLFVSIYFTITKNESNCVQGKLECFSDTIKLSIDNEIVIKEFKIRSNHRDLRAENVDDSYKGLQDDENEKNGIIGLVKDFFYTIVSNYSMQSFVEKNYRRKCYTYGVDPDLPPRLSNIPHDQNVGSQPWINSIFHKNDGYIRPLVLNPYRDKGSIDLNKEMTLSKDRFVSLLIYSKANGSKFFHPYDFGFIQVKPNKWNISNILKCFKKEYKSKLLKKTLSSDLSPWLRDMIDCIFQIAEDKKGIAIHNLQAEDVANRIFTVNDRISDIFSRKIIEIFNLDKIEGSYWLKAGLCYIRLKIFKVIFKYDEYKDKRKKIIEAVLYENNETKINILLDDVIRSMINKSHVTKKIRRTVNFLFLQYYPKYVLGQKNCVNINFEVLVKNIEKLNNTPWGYDKIIYNELIKTLSIDLIDDCMPPPFFSYSILLKKEGEKEYINYNYLSSGELQLFQTISVHIYHLLNLISVQKHRPKYRNFNLIFDELEICLHPEYQRLFIHALIKALNQILLNKNDCWINIFIITHSPFVLSDIPANNILYLKEGLAYNNEAKKTFGANINDLCKDSFFLENGFIGEWAKEKINGLLDYLEGKNDSEWNKRNSFSFINTIVGEPLIKDCLKRMYKNKFGYIDE